MAMPIEHALVNGELYGGAHQRNHFSSIASTLPCLLPTTSPTHLATPQPPQLPTVSALRHPMTAHVSSHSPVHMSDPSLPSGPPQHFPQTRHQPFSEQPQLHASKDFPSLRTQQQSYQPDPMERYNMYQFPSTRYPVPCQCPHCYHAATYSIGNECWYSEQLPGNYPSNTSPSSVQMPDCVLANTPTMPAAIRPRASTKNQRIRTCDKYRQVYSEYQKIELEKEYVMQKYVTSKRKSELAHILSLTERQVKIWFQNRRAKERRVSKRKFSFMSTDLLTSPLDDSSIDQLSTSF